MKYINLQGILIEGVINKASSTNYSELQHSCRKSLSPTKLTETDTLIILRFSTYLFELFVFT